MEQRCANENKLLHYSMIQTDFKAKTITGDSRDHCINEGRNNAPGKQNNFKLVCT